MKTKSTFWTHDDIQAYRTHINRDSWFLKGQFFLCLLVLLGVILYLFMRH